MTPVKLSEERRTQPTDGMTDAQWREVAVEIRGGWIPARFDIAGNAPGNGPLGWTRGSFGIFEGNIDSAAGKISVTSITQLKTGARIALFAFPEDAAVAAELAERVGDWSEVTAAGIQNAAWQKRAKHMYALWESAGYRLFPIPGAFKPIWVTPEFIGARANG